jgi:hypothetical protein
VGFLREIAGFIDFTEAGAAADFHRFPFSVHEEHLRH